jgi:hypothetical protein
MQRMKKMSPKPVRQKPAVPDKQGDEFAYPPSEPPSEDIYSQAVEVNLDPNDLISMKEIEPEGKWNEKVFREDMSGDDLDIPGAELDDEMEKIGEEDEENNYYSLGGDNHEDLEENNL